jgi:acyl carrier protein
MTIDVESKVLAIIARVTRSDLSEVTRQATLVGDLGVDSPTALLLLVELEDALGITMSDTAAAGMTTVGDILDYLEGRV